jgi:hypothetical protein
MPQLVIVADDLTGAADTSACFAQAGLSTVIHLSGTTVPNADVLAVSTESRDLDKIAAVAAVRSALSLIIGGQPGAAPWWIYKKMDSALRGHPRDELLAAMEAIRSPTWSLSLKLTKGRRFASLIWPRSGERPMPSGVSCTTRTGSSSPTQRRMTI